jgi:Flp pilus assembly CpaE family ATPase
MVTGFGQPVSLHFLPDDRDAVDRALVTGRTLVESAPDSPIVRALTGVADTVAPDEVAVRNGRRVGRGVRWRTAATGRRP